MQTKFAFIFTFTITFATLSCCVGCQTMKSDRAAQSHDQEYSGQAKPWVKEVSPASYINTEDDTYLLDDGAGDRLQAQWQAMVGKGPNQQVANDLKNDADRFFDLAAEKKKEGIAPEKFKHEFRQAASLYTAAAQRWPKSSLEQEALFRAGEAHFFSDNYVGANASYEKLVARYRGTRYMDVVQARRFTIAQYWLELNRKSSDNFFTYRRSGLRPSRDTGGEALRILDRIRLDDPTGKLADDATLALANGQFEKKMYLEASDAYEDLRRTFPNSEHIFDAHLFELRSRLQTYQGRSYNAANLQKAEELLKTVVNQFPKQAEKHREYLSKEAANIRMKQAERELALAEYYENREEYRAAVAHYEEIVANFGDTPIGEKARKRIPALTGKPAVPEQRLSWLVDLFPDAKATKPLIPAGGASTLQR